MRHPIVLLSCATTILLGVAAAISAAPAGGQANTKPIPPFSEVQQTVSRHFQTRPDFQPGDLITREDVAPLLTQLQKMGLPLADAGKILEKVPAKGEFLVDQLSTPNGRKFMRHIATYPNGYDRVDRLSRLPQGHQTIRMLVQDPGGHRMIEYMTNTKGGKELGRMLSADPNDKQFNAPTGRIYTVTMLLARLQQSHAAALKAAGKLQGSADAPDRLDHDGRRRRAFDVRGVADLRVGDAVDNV